MKRVVMFPLGALVAGLAACSTDMMSYDSDAVIVESVSPPNGAVVATTTLVSVTFSHPMMQGMESLIAVHEGSVTGPAVSGSAAWSADRRTLTFTPSASLKAATMYVLHLAPGLRSTDGVYVNHESCGVMGGRSVSSSMMGSSGRGPGMMGDGWQAIDGTYGIIFTFTTN
jgi:hypothetical protein